MTDVTPKRPEWRGANVADRTGQRYGKLVALRRVENVPPSGTLGDNERRRSRVQWLCICDCGNERIVQGRDLRSGGGTRSCGCAKHTSRSALYQLKNPLPPGRAARNIVFATYRSSARTRGLAWELTGEQFDEITAKDCTYCGCPPAMVKRNPYRNSSEWVYNGIDRKDSALGYVPGNVLPACRVCNNAKSNMSYDEFLAWIARLTEYHWFRPDVMPSRLIRKAAKSA